MRDELRGLDIMDCGQGDGSQVFAFWAGAFGGVEAVSLIEFFEATADCRGCYAEVTGDSTQWPAAEVAQAQESAVGVG